MADEIVDVFDAHPARVRVVHPGVPDLPSLGVAEATATLRSVLPPEMARYCLAVGTAEPRKDLPGLVRAFGVLGTRFPDLSLVIAGPSGWGEEALAAAITVSPVRDRIVRTGWVAPRALAALLSGAAVLAYPSVYEGFGFPPLQAMRAGVPVVASGAGSLPEVLGDGALLVEPGTQEDLIEALTACLDDEAMRARLVAAGQQRAAEFTWERCGAGLEALYRDARAGSDGG